MIFSFFTDLIHLCSLQQQRTTNKYFLALSTIDNNNIDYNIALKAADLVIAADYGPL